MIPDNELYAMFEKAFSSQNLSVRVDFVKDVLRRYKAMGEPVFMSGMTLPSPFALLTICPVDPLMMVPN